MRPGRSFLPVPGIAYNDPSQWLTDSPTLASVADRVPPVAGESGEHACGHTFIDHATAPVPTTAPAPYDGTPPHNGTPALGTGLRDHLRALN